MINNPVGWFEIYVQDMQRAKAFYENVFGLKLARLDGTGVEMWGVSDATRALWRPGRLGADAGFSVGRKRCSRVLHLRRLRSGGGESREFRRTDREGQVLH